MAVDVDYPAALLAALAVVVGVALLWAGSTSGAAFGAYNPAWDGASDLRAAAGEAGAEVTVARNATAYERIPAVGTVAVVLSPETGYGPADSSRLRRFVEAGGTLVVAEDYGPHANPLLAAVGADARVDGRPLLDEQHYYRSPELPVAEAVASHRYTVGVESLTLNHGTAVEPGGAPVLVNSSDLAYLDANGNGALDDAESVGPYPVATVEPVGDGAVVVVGDASALINVMLDRPGNRAFVAAVFAAHDRVLLDYSHAGALPPLSVAVLALRESALLLALVGVGAVGAVGLWAGWPAVARRLRRSDRVEPAGRSAPLLPPWPSRRSPTARASPEAIAAHLRERHPEWAPERVQRVVEAVVGRGETGRRDEDRRGGGARRPGGRR